MEVPVVQSYWRWLVYAGAAAAVVGGVGISWLGDRDARGTASALHEDRASEDFVSVEPDTDPEIARMNSRIAGLEARLRQAQLTSAQRPGRMEPLASEEPVREMDPEEVRAAQEVQLQRHEDYLREIVLDEARDDEWHWAVSESLQNAAIAIGAQVEVRSVRCATTLCEVRFGHSGAMAHQQIHSAAMDMQMPGFGGAALVRRREVAGGYETVIMMARPGEMLPRIEPDAASM